MVDKLALGQVFLTVLCSVEMGGTCSAYVREKRVLVGKPEGKRPLGRPRSRWEDNIKMYLREVGCGGMHWIDLAQDTDG